MRACRSTDLYLTMGPVGAGAGQRYTTLNLRTLRGRICVLHNDLTGFRFIRGDGARLPTHARRTGDPATSVTLRPGVTARLDLHFTVVGRPRFTPRSLMFTVPADGGRVTVGWPPETPVGDGGRIEVGRLHR